LHTFCIHDDLVVCRCITYSSYFNVYFFFLHISLLFFFFFLMLPPPPRSTLFPYTTLFRSHFRDFALSSSNQFSTTISLSGAPVCTGRIIKKRRSSRATSYCGVNLRDENPAAGKSATERPSENVGLVCTTTATRSPEASR